MEERIRLDILVSFVTPFSLLFEQKALHFHLALALQIVQLARLGHLSERCLVDQPT